MVTSIDATPAGTFLTKAWNFTKKHAVTFLVGIGAGVGITLAVQHTQRSEEEYCICDETMFTEVN